MRIVIGYPPIPGIEGRAQVGQNRQYQEFSEPTSIYPVIPAYAATMLKKAGHEVIWMDGPAEGQNWDFYYSQLIFQKPDLIVWEVKTPVVKMVWPLINELKKWMPDTKVVLMGDHITALPEESLETCNVDFVIRGGDFDFSLLSLVGDLQNNKTARSNMVEIGTNSALSELPVIDRQLTKWRMYAEKNGNFKYLPATYTMFGRDCWWRQGGGCTFCSWTSTFKNFRVISVSQAMSEVENCASLGIREIFDDTGTFPAGAWLSSFCTEMNKFNGGKRHGKARITMGCNMRPGALNGDQWKEMAESGFRFILFGLESANYETLKRINKGQKEHDMWDSAKMAKRAGLEPHVTCMVGYPWETREEAENTISLARRLFQHGYIDTLQATIIIPYPGTELFRQAEKEGWLRYGRDWNQYGMDKPVMKCPMTDETVLQMTRGIYKSCLTPQFLVRKLLSTRTKDDVKYLWRGLRYVMGHLKDFSERETHVH